MDKDMHPATEKAILAVMDLANELEIARKGTALLDRMQNVRVLLTSETQGVCVGGPHDGWLVWKHPDGQWVTSRKLEEVRLEALDDISGDRANDRVPSKTTPDDIWRRHHLGSSPNRNLNSGGHAKGYAEVGVFANSRKV